MRLTWEWDHQHEATVSGVAAALFLAAGQASAEGLSRGSRIGSDGFRPQWTGLYAGAGVGAGAVVYDAGANLFGYELLGVGGEGVFGTVAVGYDREIRPGWVLGVFADCDFASSISTDLRFLGDTVAWIEKGDSLAVGARLGFLPTASTFIYGTGGYTQADFGDGTFEGFFVGAGIETMLRSSWSLKLEYRYAQFDEIKFGDDCFNLSVEPSEQTRAWS